ncbi:MAG: HAMP domain-containing histidine kinase [Gammaproteobacteria bacterium]|nr:HAMP domain-containing histidine kinase [Gammaproteobacteria bacterium]
MWTPKRRSSETRFNLVRWFSVAGFFAVALLSIISASIFSKMLMNQVLEHDAHVMTELVNSIIRQDTGTNSRVTVISDSDTNKLAVFFTQLGKVPGILRANVYSTEHKILWSSHEALLDKQFKDNEELRESLKGRPVAHLEDGHEEIKSEHVLLSESPDNFVEYYLPIWETETQHTNVLAVAEVYRVPFGLMEHLVKIKTTVWTVSIIGGLFLFLSLFWVIRRAAETIKVQDKRILETQRLVTIGEMASTVAHGLRNPLSSIRSSAELALENKNDDETNQSLEHIIVETDTIEAWVRQYLSEIKADTTQQELCDIEKAINESLSMLKSHPLTKEITFEKELAERQYEVKFNFLVLVQIITGLLSNAIEAKPKDKRVIIKTGPGRRDKEMRLQIIDYGSGISPEDAERIFAPFYTTKRNGLGIGLTLTRQILERNKGSLEITSDKESGTRVNMYLQLEQS